MMDSEEFKTMSGGELMRMELPRQQFCIEGILPRGLSMLTCAKEDAARGLALDMSLCVSAGQMLWGSKVQQGAVLHMIHADTLFVTRNRLMEMTKRVPDDLYVGVMTEAAPELLVSALPAFTQSHPNASLLVVELDSPVAYTDDKLYVAGEALIHYSRLKEMAVQYGLAVLIVQRSVGSKYSLDLSSVDDAACISDEIAAHFELCPDSYHQNQAELKRSSRVYGNGAWEIVHSAKSHRWELRKQPK